MAWTTPRTWVAGETVTAAIMNTHVRDNLTAAATTYVGSNSSATGVTLATAGTLVASSAKVTFTLAVQTRVAIDGSIQFSMAGGTNGVYFSQSGYNSGATATIGSVTRLGFTGITNIASTTLGLGSVASVGDVLLAAGQYTAYLAVQRNSGGGATDTAVNGYVRVTSIGFV